MCEIELDAPLPLRETREPASRLCSPKYRCPGLSGIRRLLLTPNKKKKSVRVNPPAGANDSFSGCDQESFSERRLMFRVCEEGGGPRSD